jgi:hypothetical protein
MQRRPVTAMPPLVRIGKGADRVELMEADLLNAKDAVTVYSVSPDQLDEALAFLSEMSGRELARMLGKDRRTIDRIRRGEAQPRPELAARLMNLAASRRDEPLR